MPIATPRGLIVFNQDSIGMLTGILVIFSVLIWAGKFS